MADGVDVSDLVPEREDIRLIHMDGGIQSIGEKRNLACKFARGEVICHWDDDDWSSPVRLIDQITRLEVIGCNVTGYHSMAFTDGSQWWKYQGAPDYALGTSLCYRRSWWEQHPFQPKNIGEDNYFVAEAHAARTLASVDAGGLMYATNHAGNTSPRRISAHWLPVEGCPTP